MSLDSFPAGGSEVIFKVLAQFGTDDIKDSRSASVPMYLIELQGLQHWLGSDTCLALANGMLVQSRCENEHWACSLLHISHHHDNLP